MTDIIGYAPNILYIMIPIFLNIILNIIFIVLDILQFFRKGNNKMTSLDKILFPLSLSELMISIFWCLSGFILDNKEKIKENENECQVIGNFHIFFYFFEFLLIYFIITHLKHLVLNLFYNHTFKTFSFESFELYFKIKEKNNKISFNKCYCFFNFGFNLFFFRFNRRVTYDNLSFKL